MDHDFATANPQQTTTEIPAGIHQSLFNIALLGYEAKDVGFWYQSVLQNLRRMGPDRANEATTGLSIVADDSIDAQYAAFLHADCDARRATLATIDSCMSPSTEVRAVPSTEYPSVEGDYPQAGTIYTVPTQDSTSQAYNTPQSYQTYTTTPQKLDMTPEPPQTQPFMAAWSPAPSSAAEPDLYALSASGAVSNNNLLAFAGEPANAMPAYPWFNTQDLGSLHSRNPSQQSHLSQQSLPSSTQHMTQLSHQPYLSPEYNTQLSGTAMPVLVPYASSGGSGNYTKAAAIPTGPGASLYSSSSGFFPIIHVSSSRRRRKALQKGVKKMVQPLKGRRQQSV